MRIAVVGGGVGGFASAALLAEQGHDVTVFEASPEIRPVGAGLLLQPTGAAVLERLGVLDQVRDRGAPIRTLVGLTRRRRTVFDIAYGDLAPGMEATGVHRTSLVSAVQEAARVRGVRVCTGARVLRAEAAAAAAATATGGSGVRTRAALVTEGGAEGPFDLVVGADGMRSALRAAHMPEAHAPPFAYGAVWSLVEDPDGALLASGALQQRYDGPRRMAGVLPVGRAAAGDARAQATLFWSLPPGAEAVWLEAAAAGRGSAASARAVASWRAQARALWPEMDERAWRVSQDAADFVFASYHDVHARRWHRGGDDGWAEGAYWDGAGSPLLGPGATPVRTTDPVFRLLHPDPATRAHARAMDRAAGPGLTAGRADAGAPPLVLVGDAAHGTSPQLGQGANLALADALALAECLALHAGAGAGAGLAAPPFAYGPHGVSAFTGRAWAAEEAARRGRRLTLGAALRLYEAERAPAVWFYQFFSRYLTLFFQSDFAALGWARDAAFGPLARVPLLGENMLRTLAGVKVGLLRSRDPAQWLDACVAAARARGQRVAEPRPARAHLWRVADSWVA